MAEMSKKEIRKFLMQGTFTGKLATVKKDRSSHIVPIWFVLDGGNKTGDRRKGEEDDIIFTTDGTSVKAKNIQRDNRVSICVDDQTPPFSFVILYGRRNSTEGEVLVRIKPTRIIAEKDIAGWD